MGAYADKATGKVPLSSMREGAGSKSRHAREWSDWGRGGLMLLQTRPSDADSGG